ncbi:MAG: S8 family serine peptidase [Butyricimonas faecihominis]
MAKEPMSSWSHIYEKRHTLVENAGRIPKRLDRTLASESAQAALGDRQGNWRDRKYGNNNLFGEKSSLHWNACGRYRGATRHNGLGIDGVADVELMFLRISEGDGDERDKDVASAIFYAVENGARVINMSFATSTV